MGQEIKGYWKTKICDLRYPKPGEEDKGMVMNIRGYPLMQIMGNLSYAEATFLAIRGRLPSEGEEKMLNSILCCLVDVSLHKPGTVTARITVSCHPEFYQGLAAAVLAVGKNTLNPQYAAEFIAEAYEMMKEQGLSMEETAKRMVEQYGREKKRIPGFGLPFKIDPRAVRLRELALKFRVLGEKTHLYEAIHREFTKNPKRKDIVINDVGMMGAIMSDMGFDPMEMAGIAFMAVMPGTIAHIVEEVREGVILRMVPEEMIEYIGPPQRDLPEEKMKY